MGHLAVLLTIAFLVATNRVPNSLIMMRAVAPKDKGAAVSSCLSMVSTFALLPAPFLYAALYDNSCVLWDVSECSDQSRHCLLYDTDKMRRLVHFVSAAFVALGIACDVIVFRNVKNLKMYDFDQEEKEKEAISTISLQEIALLPKNANNGQEPLKVKLETEATL